MKPKYSLHIYDSAPNDDPEGSTELLHWSALESLPRIEVGDHLGALYFSPHADVGQRFVVTDARYSFGGDPGSPEISLYLSARLETPTEEGARQRASSSPVA